METLPNELVENILSKLTCRQVASAAKVCKTWNKATSLEEVWESLFVRRWGEAKAERAFIKLSVGSWKSAYEARHRHERIGKEWILIREGDCVYTAKNGVLLRCMVRPSLNSNSRTPESSSSDPRTVVQSKKRSVESCGEICTTKMEERTSSSGLLDKLLLFATELHTPKHRGGKYMRVYK